MKNIKRVLVLLLLLLSVVSVGAFTGKAEAAQTFIKPVEGTYSSEFGSPRPNNRKHAGIDISGNNGKTIVASATGTVIRSGSAMGTYGEHIQIRHNIGGQTYDTFYAHMQSGSRKVAVNSTVTQGQAIGIVGNTGTSVPHLHFELHKGMWNSNTTNAIDPKPYITGQINIEIPHTYDGTWASVVITSPNGGPTANLFRSVGAGIIGTLPVGGGYRVYDVREYATNGDMYYNVGAGYIHHAYGIITNHHARVSSTITTHLSPNGPQGGKLSPGTYRVHGAKDNWYNLGGDTWVKPNQVVVTKQ